MARTVADRVELALFQPVRKVHEPDAHAAVGVPPEILQEIRDSVRTMTGLRGTYLTNSCLYADAIEFDEHPGLDSRLEEQNTDLRSSPGLMSDPLPAEADLC